MSDSERRLLCTSRDYDSLLGLSRHIRCHSALNIYPIPRYEDSLKKNVHLSHLMWIDGEETKVPYHQIPNICLGTWQGSNTLLRVLFPALHGPTRRSHHLKKEEEVAFLNQGLLPALREILDHRATGVALDHQSESFRTRLRNGRFAFGTNILPEWGVRSLADTIRQKLRENGVGWGADLLILHQIRGVKNATYSSGEGDEEALEATWQFLQEYGLDYDELIEDADSDDGVGSWWVDVGMEIMSSDESYALVPDTQMHGRIVELLLEISAGQADRATQLSSSGYHRDPAGGLTGASGFRLTPPSRARGPHHVAYMQVYLTDKAFTYAPEGATFGKTITPFDLLEGKGDAFFHQLCRVFNIASEKAKSAVRIECRVPLASAHLIYNQVDRNELCDTILVFYRTVYWDFRAWRVLAVQYPMQWQLEGTPAERVRESALQFTAACAWLVNGLVSTPDLGPSYRELCEVILPRGRRDQVAKRDLIYPIKLIVRDEEEESGSDDSEPPTYPRDEDYNSDSNIRRHTPVIHGDVDHDRSRVGVVEPISRVAQPQDLVPHAPYGVIFLRELRGGDPPPPIPRLRDRRLFLSTPSFLYIFTKSRDDLKTRFESAKIAKPANPNRLRNKVLQPLIPAPDPANFVGFNLEENGMSVDPAPRDTGSDLSDEEWLDPEEERNVGLNAVVETIWNQMLHDVMHLSPNRKNATEGAYIHLKRNDELDSVTIDIYRKRYLGEVFDDVQWLKGTREDWRRVFDNLFTPKDVVKIKPIQNYDKARYFGMWRALVDRASPSVAEAAREALWCIFKTLEWAPYAEVRRIWNTRSDQSGFSKNSGKPLSQPAPRIIVRHTPKWLPDD
ncbi:hypothetical protein FA15DRAFT_629305 [Coprinopsis marcescibilis]|uniref:Uncharacterized protein n=1 Tax=Coprinopsis marcescibilis TaxID=230819 RepID=A0A5C3K9R4_COPMA|nr:hypothetical protein FA15DRAFT_629305 [Coprinopsis marcescibilis]